MLHSFRCDNDSLIFREAIVIKTMAVAAAFALSTAASALTVHSGVFMSGATAFNGLEGIGGTDSFPAATQYTEQGITLEYIGTAQIWTTSQAAEGNYSWYENGGGSGYTRVTFAAPVNALQFYAGSGFGGSPSLSLQYEVRNAGALVGTGAIPGISGYTGFNAYGFSGATFDEVRLQVQYDAASFDPVAFEAGAYDAFSTGGTIAGVPEPASWMLMIAGFGLVGVARRRQPTLVAA